MCSLLADTYLSDFYRTHYGIFYGTSIAVTIRSLDPSLFSRLIAHYTTIALPIQSVDPSLEDLYRGRYSLP